MKAGGGGETHLSWFDRAGTSTGSIVRPTTGEYLNPAISPDGQRVAVNRMDPATGNWDIWIVDLTRDGASRFTSDPAADGDPVWSPDGKQIVFASNRGGEFGLYRKTVDGSSPEELLANVGQSVIGVAPTDWSADGRHVLYYRGKRTPQGWGVWALPLDGERRSVPVIRTTSDRTPPGFRRTASGSPTRRRRPGITRCSCGRSSLQVTSGKSRSAAVRTRDGPPADASWSTGGVLDSVSAVDIGTTGSTLRVGAPKPIMSTPFLTLIDGRPHYDVTPGGHRFLLRQPAGVQRPAISVIVNWPAKLKKSGG